MRAKKYDIIGDVHAHYDKLVALLERMGYAEVDGAWRHPARVAIFVGDFVDRGPGHEKTFRLVKAMVEAGSALAVMGNHELNAIGWVTPHPAEPGRFLRPRDGAKGESNRHHHKEFLEQVGQDSKLHEEMIAWFMTLPLFLDLPELRVAHACWHPAAIETILARLGPEAKLSPQTLHEALSPLDRPREEGEPLGLFEAIELVCKGVEVVLPDGASYKDQDGFERDRARSRWWDPEAVTFRSAAMLRESLRSSLPNHPLPADAMLPTMADKPVFFGHYWMTGRPEPVGAHAACVDYSAAKAGPLVAYRHDGESPLTADRFVSSDD
jgi:hypothetical protein